MITREELAKMTVVTEPEIVTYASACFKYVNTVPPEVLVGNYSGHVAMHADLVKPILGQYLKPESRVLDFGCGVGRVTGVLAELGMQVVGADISWVALSRAARMYPNALFFLLSSNAAFPFPPESFDAVVSMICFQHIQFFPIRHRYITGIHRILRSGGTIVFQLNASGGGNCIRWFDRGDPGSYVAPDVVCNEQEITDYLTAVGFTVAETWRTYADSQDVSWDVVPRKTSSEWLWVVATKSGPSGIGLYASNGQVEV